MRKRLNQFDARAQQALQQRFGTEAGTIEALVEEEEGILYVTPAAPQMRTGTQATTFALGDLVARQEGEQEIIDLSFSSEYPVMRYGDVEILSHDPEDCDIKRLAEVGSILRNHDPDQVVGVPVKVLLDATERRGRLSMRFGTTDCAKAARQEVLVDKTVRGVSVGYSVASWVFLKDESVTYKNRIKGPAWVAAKWSALEVSLTPIPADPSVGVNRNEGATNVNQVQLKRLADLEAKQATGALTDAERRELSDLQAMRAAGQTPATPAAATPGAAGAAATRAEGTQPPAAPAGQAASTPDAAQTERTRILEIQTRCRRFGLPDAFMVELINSGLTLERACQRIVDRLSERDTAAGGGSISVLRDGRSSAFEAMLEGLQVRAGVMKREDAKTGLHFANYSLYELGRESLRSAGMSDHGDKRAVAGLMLRHDGAPINRDLIEGVLLRKETITGSTGDFAILLAAVAYKTLMAAYQLAPIHYKRWCKVGSVSDFKDANRIEFSESGDLQLIPELGPYKATKFKDKQEKNRVYTWGRIFTMSRQGIINDDLGGFLTIPQAFGRKARVLPQTLALKKLLANPVLIQDNVAVFAAGHGNLGTGSGYALDTLAHAEAGIKRATAAMRAQKAFTHADEAASAEYLNLSPRVLLCNGTDDFVARTATRSAGSLAANQNAGVINPLSGLNLEVIAEANIANTAWTGASATQWFLLADPNEAPVMEVVFLNGDETPFMEEEDQTNVDGRSWKVRLDCGCEAIGYKGAVKEAGA